MVGDFSNLRMDEPEVDGVGKKLSLATVEKSTDKRFELLDSVIESLENNENAILDNFQVIFISVRLLIQI